MIATSDFLTALECAKFVFGRGSDPDPAGRAYGASPPLAGLRDPTSKRRAGERKERGKKKDGGEERERE